MVIPPKDICFLDFETFYDKKAKYSLRSQGMSTTAYTRDERFKAHSMAFRHGRMRKARVVFGHDAIQRELNKIDWKRTAVCAHHAHFDGGILSYHFNVVPTFYFCTMSMARPLVGHNIGAGLDEVAKYYGLGGKVNSDALTAIDGIRDPSKEQLKQLGIYNCDDVDDMYHIFHEMRPELPHDEILLIHHTVKAYADPVLGVNRALATSEWEREKAERRKIILKANPVIRDLYNMLRDQGRLDDLPIARNKPSQKNPLGTPKKVKDMPINEEQLWEPTKDREDRFQRLCKIISSPDKLAVLFKLIGQPPPMKWSVKQEKDIPAFAIGDLDFQALEHHPMKEVRLLYAARVAVKSDMAEQRAHRLLLHSATAPLPIYLNYAKAHTLRWTGGDLMNPQNFPRGSDLRRCLIAPIGYKINVVDSGQIEARTNAMVSGQLDLLQQFADYDHNVEKYGKNSIEAKSRDPYRIMAANIYGGKPEDMDNDQRFVGKVAVLGLGYQMGVDKFLYTLEAGMMGPSVVVPRDVGEKAVKTYRSSNDKIKEFWGFLQNEAIPVLAGMHPHMDEVGWDFNDDQGQLWFEKGVIHLPNGMHLFYNDIERSKGQYGWEYRYRVNPHEWSKLYGGLLAENIIQCLARIIVGEQVIEIGHKYRIVTLTHDECVYISKNRSAAVAQRYGEKCFTVAKDWYAGLPLKGEGGYDDCYSK
jgi:DNA polymerase